MKIKAWLAIGAGFALVVYLLPVSFVMAHSCNTTVREAPSNPKDPNTGCDGVACPCVSAPHDHRNRVPPNSCSNPAPSCCDPYGGKGRSSPRERGNAYASSGGSREALASATLAVDGVTGSVTPPDYDLRCGAGGAGVGGSASSSNCPHASGHLHGYGVSVSAGGQSDTLTGGDVTGLGFATVSDTNSQDCDGDGIPGDYDGDYETGVGGGFFGYGPWANEPTCNYGLMIHGGTATVSDVVFGSTIAFVIGADDTSGPAISTDPVTGETTCETDGSITPGDPTTDPTADLDDCLTDVYVGSGTTCGAGGDGGYWVFLNGALVSEGSGGVGANNVPTAGTITA